MGMSVPTAGQTTTPPVAIVVSAAITTNTPRPAIDEPGGADTVAIDAMLVGFAGMSTRAAMFPIGPEIAALAITFG